MFKKLSILVAGASLLVGCATKEEIGVEMKPHESTEGERNMEYTAAGMSIAGSLASVAVTKNTGAQRDINAEFGISNSASKSTGMVVTDKMRKLSWFEETLGFKKKRFLVMKKYTHKWTKECHYETGYFFVIEVQKCPSYLYQKIIDNDTDFNQDDPRIHNPNK
jgi:hypothetical protein